MALDNLHIIGLEVENVKRISVVKLKPGAGLVEVSGNNRQGKSSLLDSIEMAIGGGRSIPWEPIRKGEERGRIRLDLGNGEGLKLRLTRGFTAQDTSEGGPTYTTSLKVENEDGMQPKGAQTLLKTIISGLSFDPEAFISADDDEQVKTLQRLVPSFDFADAARRRKEAFDNRTDANRETKRLQMSSDAIDVPAGTPTEVVDTAALVAELRAVGDMRAEIDGKRRGREEFVASTEAMEMEVAKDRVRAQRLREEADEIDRIAAGEADEARKRRQGINNWPALPDPPDAAAIEAAIKAATATNASVAKLANRADLARRAKASADLAASLTAAIAQVDRDSADAIAAADLPVSGLAIQDGMVMLRGVPFAQASTAEQIRTSLAIGMQMNPRLKVMRLRQGSLLDDEAWSIIAEVAEEEGYQVWAETIKAHGPDAIIMEAGQVKGAVE